MTQKIVFLDRASLAPGTELRSPAFDHDWVDFDETRPDQVGARIADADVVVTNKVPVSADDMAGAPNLKFIAVCATGTDIVALKAENEALKAKLAALEAK